MSILKNFKNGEKVTIVRVKCGDIEYLIPDDVIQLGPYCNVEIYDKTKFYFKIHTEVKVYYQTEDGSSKSQDLRNIKQVRWDPLLISLFVTF